MGRTIKEIKASIKQAWINDKKLCEAYGLKEPISFDDVFSKASLEVRIIDVFASAVWLLETLFDSFRSETEQRIEQSYVTSAPWYYAKAREWQKGDATMFDEKTYSFRYEKVDETKRVVKNVAVREVVDDGVTKLKIYFSDAAKQPLQGDDRTAFERYMRRIGAAGTHYIFVSEKPDVIRVHLRVFYDPLILDSSGVQLDGGEKPVENAIEAYLDALEYGGTFYASKLIDMLQSTPGVKDVILEGTTWKGEKENRRRIDAESGAFVYDRMDGDIVYTIE